MIQNEISIDWGFTIQHKEPVDYWAQMKEKGYYHVKMPNDYKNKWPQIHQWCRQTLDHYTWTGTTFWFKTEKDALLFTLRWS